MLIENFANVNSVVFHKVMFFIRFLLIQNRFITGPLIISLPSKDTNFDKTSFANILINCLHNILRKKLKLLSVFVGDQIRENLNKGNQLRCYTGSKLDPSRDFLPFVSALEIKPKLLAK